MTRLDTDPGHCLEDDDLAALADGELAAEARVAIERHIDRCETCGALAAEFARGFASASPGMAAPGLPWLTAGDRVGRYRIERWLARGGMGQLYVAADPELGREVALKLVRAGIGKPDQLLAEAQAMARLSHPNVVSVHDAGTHGDETFIAMELVEGETLGAWQREGPRRWRAVLDAYLQAGRGLAAAHAAGVIHRDFKPENALIAGDGRVQVTDFGLARAEMASADNLAAGGGLVATTTIGGLVGTPAYMAPEQLESGPATEASDQFSFCVALHEALFGERPFAGDDLEALIANVTGGKVRAPARGGVPARLRRVVARGLRVDPDERYPSMEALLAGLERAARARGRWIAAAAGVSILAVAGAVALGGDGDELEPCSAGADLRLTAAWNPAARARLRQAFLATETIYGEGSGRAVEGRFDYVSRTLARGYREVCQLEAKAAGDPAQLAARRACLDGALTELVSVRDRLLFGDVDVLEAGVSAAFGVSDPARCEAAAGRAGRAGPPGADIAERVADIRRRAAEIRARRLTGDHESAIEPLRALAAEAEELGYRPLVADIYGSLITSLTAVEDWAGARDAAHRSLQAAQAVGSNSMVGRAALELAEIDARDRQRLDEALRWAELAESAIDGLGDERAAPQLRAALAGARGLIHQRRGKFELALAQYRERAEHEASAHPEERHHHGAAAQLQIGTALYRLGRYDEAAEASAAAVAGYEAVFGPEHFTLVTPLTQLGASLERTGDLDGAIANHRRAARLSRAIYGDTSVRLGSVYNNLALALESRGDLAEAVDYLERAAAIYREHESDDRLGLTLINLAGAQSSLGRHAEAVANARSAVDTVTAAYGPEHPYMASTHNVLGEALCDAGDCDAARGHFERAIELRTAALGDEHPDLGSSYFGLARAHTEAGRHGAAIANLERALAVASKSERAKAQLALARAVWRGRRDRARSIELATRARDAASGELRARAEAWLTERGAAR